MRWRTDRKKRTRYPCDLPRGSWTGWRIPTSHIFLKACREYHPAPRPYRLADCGHSDSCHAASTVDHRGHLPDHGRAGGTVWERELFPLISGTRSHITRPDFSGEVVRLACMQLNGRILAN